MSTNIIKYAKVTELPETPDFNTWYFLINGSTVQTWKSNDKAVLKRVGRSFERTLAMWAAVSGSGDGGGEDTNIANSDLVLDADHQVDIGQHSLVFMQDLFYQYLAINGGGSTKQVTIQAPNQAGNTGSMNLNANDSSASSAMVANFNNNEESASFVLSAQTGLANANVNCRLFNVSRGQIRADDYGDGSKLGSDMFLLGVDADGNFVEANPPVMIDNADAIANDVLPGKPFLMVDESGNAFLMIAKAL